MNNIIPFSHNTIREHPANVDAERALLGTLILRNAVFDRIVDQLKPEHFSDQANGALFAHISQMLGMGRTVTPQTLKTFAEASGPVQSAGGMKYIVDLCASAPTLINAPEYANLIHDLYLRREIIALTTHATVEAFDTMEPASDQISAIEERLFSLTETGSQSAAVSLGSAATEAISRAEIAYKADGKLIGVPTGIIDLDRKLGGFHKTDLIILAGRPSMGKAQPLDAKVLLANGQFKDMGALKVGDGLASVDGAPSKVAAIYPQGVREVYRVTLRDGRCVEACAEHLWRVYCRHWNQPRILTTAEVRRKLERKRYQKRLWIDTVTGDFGGEPLPLEPWLLGVLIGDGGLTRETPRFTSADPELVEKVRVCLGDELTLTYENPYGYYIVQRGGARRKGIAGSRANPLATTLKTLGLYGHRSEAKFIPEQYLTASRADRLELMRGLMDTDGCVEKFGAMYFCTSSERLARDFQRLAWSLGAVCTIRSMDAAYTSKGERRVGLRAYRCNVSHPIGRDFFSLERKKKRANRVRERRPLIESITLSRTADTRCIRVTHPRSLYVTDNYIVTHNSGCALTFAINAAKAGKHVAFFSLEMSAEQLANRALAKMTGLDSHDIQNGRLRQGDFQKLLQARQDFGELPFEIDDRSTPSIAQIRTAARRMKRKKGLDLIIVDYLQLITPSRTGREENRVNEVSGISRGLKAIAKDMNIPVVALSQLSRDVERREDKRPQLADLRDSGSIEQDADVVMFVFREEYYAERAGKFVGPELENVAEINLAKQRHGPIGGIKCRFEKRSAWFENLARG